MSLPVREGPVSQSAPIDNIAQMVAQGRFDRQLELVGEHWASVRRLWLGDSNCFGAETFRSGLPEGFLLGVGMPGIGSVTALGDRFEFADNGRPAVIIPAYDSIPGLVGARAESHVEELRDLVAIDVKDPERYWRRRGEALVLGNAFLEIAGETCAPVPVFKTPMSWLQAAGAGIVVLDWDYARDLLLDRELIAEDVNLGTRLAAVLKPEIWVMGVAA